jgi:hypothetical protein
MLLSNPSLFHGHGQNKKGGNHKDYRLFRMVGAKGFEPSTARTPSVCASQAALRPDLKSLIEAEVYQILEKMSPGD